MSGRLLNFSLRVNGAGGLSTHIGPRAVCGCPVGIYVPIDTSATPFSLGDATSEGILMFEETCFWTPPISDWLIFYGKQHASQRFFQRGFVQRGPVFREERSELLRVAAQTMHFIRPDEGRIDLHAQVV